MRDVALRRLRSLAVAVLAITVMVLALVGAVLVGLGSGSTRPVGLAKRPLAASDSPQPPQREASGESESGKLRYEFAGSDHTLTVPIAEGDLRYDVNTGPIWTMDSPDRRRKRIASWVDAYARTPMIRAMATKLRRKKARLGLSRDSYVELLASVVQQIPYSAEDENFMRCPARVVKENRGDCDEKSVLLAALLRHEGYRVALLQFLDENHVTVGIRSAEIGYNGGPWAIVETTGRCYVGEIGEVRTSAGTTSLDSTPTAYLIGGSTAYGAGDQVAYILRRTKEASAEIERLGPSAREASKSHPTSVEEAERANAIIREYNDHVAAHTRAIDGSTDRAATYRWLRAH